MRYLITQLGQEPFLTPYYDYDNFYVQGMSVYDLDNLTYTSDGKIWNDITLDHL